MESDDLEKFRSMTFPLSQYRLGLPLSKHKALAPTSPRSWDLRRRQLRDGARLWYVTSRRRRRQRCDLRNSVLSDQDPPGSASASHAMAAMVFRKGRTPALATVFFSSKVRNTKNSALWVWGCYAWVERLKG